jgi:hypothetical protein
MADGFGFPIAIYTESVSPHEVRLVADTLPGRFTDDAPERVIGDKAYNSDPLDRQLAADFGVELISPHKANRKRAKTRY